VGKTGLTLFYPRLPFPSGLQAVRMQNPYHSGPLSHEIFLSIFLDL
jgi:hypothetical protein